MSDIEFGETKAQRFSRVAQHRVDRALWRIAMLEALGNRSSYEATDEQVEAIISALTDAVDVVERRLRGVKVSRPAFVLPD